MIDKNFFNKSNFMCGNFISWIRENKKYRFKTLSEYKNMTLTELKYKTLNELNKEEIK